MKSFVSLTKTSNVTFKFFIAAWSFSETCTLQANPEPSSTSIG